MIERRQFGGRRQRELRRGREPRPVLRNSRNGEASLAEWGQGLLSSIRLRQHARNTMRDHPEDIIPLDQRLGSLGGAGAVLTESRVHKNLMKLLLKDCNLDRLLTPSTVRPHGFCLLPSTICTMIFN